MVIVFGISTEGCCEKLFIDSKVRVCTVPINLSSCGIFLPYLIYNFLLFKIFAIMHPKFTYYDILNLYSEVKI